MADEPSTAIGRLALAISSPALAMAAVRCRQNLRQCLHRRRVVLAPARAPRPPADRDAPVPRGSLMAMRMASFTVSAILPVSSRNDALVIGLNKRVMVDPHLDAAAELVGVQVAGDGDQRRAVEPGVADAGREIGRAGAERGDAEPGRSGHPSGDVGGKARRAFMRGQHEIDAALAHRLHQRQHVAARDAEAAVDAGGLQCGDDEIGVVHGNMFPRKACRRHSGTHGAPIRPLAPCRARASRRSGGRGR